MLLHNNGTFIIGIHESYILFKSFVLTDPYCHFLDVSRKKVTILTVLLYSIYLTEKMHLFWSNIDNIPLWNVLWIRNPNNVSLEVHLIKVSHYKPFLMWYQEQSSLTHMFTKHALWNISSLLCHFHKFKTIDIDTIQELYLLGCMPKVNIYYI